MKANNLVIAFFGEEPPCSSQTCPEMRASEWQYLCAVHEPPKSCCAIDYCCHTLDWATNVLTSPRQFPSRLTLGSDASGGPQASMRHLTNIFRRVYRIFAHAWFQHRSVFWQVEGNDGLYMFFKTVCDIYHLIPDDGYTIPAEAEGEQLDTTEGENHDVSRRMTILRKENERPAASSTSEDTKSSSLAAPSTTRRHKHSPSTGSSVGTIVEATEDDDHVKTTQPPAQPSVLVLPELPPSQNQASSTTHDENFSPLGTPTVDGSSDGFELSTEAGSSENESSLTAQESAPVQNTSAVTNSLENSDNAKTPLEENNIQISISTSPAEPHPDEKDFSEDPSNPANKPETDADLPS